MKKKHFLLLLFLCLLASAQAQWQLIHTGFDMDFYDVECISEDTVFLCGGSILKTTNGGHTWTEKYHGTTSARYIEFADSKVGYAGYQNLLKTTDGGETWFELDISAYAIGTLQGIYLIDADTLFVCSSTKLFKSTDGGQSWAEKFSLPQHPVRNKITDAFFIENVGYLASEDYIFKSVDYSETWEIKVTSLDFTGNYSGGSKLYFQDKNNGKAFYVGGSVCLKTIDSFENYEIFDFILLHQLYYPPTPLLFYPDYGDLKFLSQQYGCLVAFDAMHSFSGIYITHNGGDEWWNYNGGIINQQEHIQAVDGFGDSTFYIASTDGLIYRTPYKSVSLNEQAVEQNIQLHPNPVKDVLNLRMTYPLEQLIIYDLLGNEIQRVDAVNATEHQMDVSWLKTGVYILKTQNATNTSIQKFIKQ